MKDRNPQAEEMASEAMQRTLVAQARAIWPQERQLVEAYALPADPQVLDLACGTGQFTSRLAGLLPHAQLLGVDLLDEHLERARSLCAEYGERVRFSQGDAFALDLPDDAFDLSACRHFLQAIPEPGRVLDELMRVTKPGGRLHLLTEDYGQIFFHPTRRDPVAFFREAAEKHRAATGIDMRGGRTFYTALRELGVREVRVDYLTLDPVHVPREDLLAIWEAWRDGYTDINARLTRFSHAEVVDFWDDMIACLQDPNGYMVWHVPVLTGLVP